MAPMDEFEIIRRWFTGIGAARDDVIHGVGDDAAVLRPPPGRDLLLTTDTLAAGIHFPEPDFSAETLGHRALAVNLSDIAAMGGDPAWALVALCLPDVRPEWLADFARGLGDTARRFDVAIAGGNLSRGPLAVTVTVAGLVASGESLMRGGARPGDALFVTGGLGGGCSGLRALQTGAPPDSTAVLPYTRPEPRIRAGRILAGYAHAAIDISDGLIGDLAKLLEAAGGLGAELDTTRFPLAPGATSADALGPSDDYELLLSIPAAVAGGVEALPATRLGCALSRVGRVVANPGIRVDGEVLGSAAATGYRHFP